MRLLFVAILVTSSVARAGTMQPVADFGANPGALSMFEYAPANLASNRPLVVVLHGCTQQATSMESAGWNALADAHGFAVIYAEQKTANNPVRCFNWAGEYGDTANLERAKGENQSIMSMIDHAIATRHSDPSRVYVLGLSAGAAFTAVMLATWPDRFAAGAIFAGVPYRCATTVNGALSCTNPGVTKSAEAWGDLLRAAGNGPWPRVQVWHGSADTTVMPVNQTELVKQWTDVHGVDAAPDATETIGKVTRSEFRDGARVVVEQYTIAGMGHAVPIGGDGCVATAGAFFSDQGICSTQRAAEFFGLVGGGNGEGSGSGSGSGSGNGSGNGGSDDEPASGSCSLAGGSAAPFAVALLAVVVRRRRRR